MAKRGPKPTPAAVLKLRRSWRAAGRGGGEKFDQKCPACPQRLIRKRETADGEAVRRVAKSTWRRLAPQLHAAGLLVDKDREMLEMLCDSFGRLMLANSKLDTEGMVTEGSTGSDVKSPWVYIRNDMWGQVAKAAACFGLTPADIANVRAVEKPTTKDEKKKFFQGAG